MTTYQLLIRFVDYLIVALLIYYLYRLLRGTRAFNIFLGLLLIYFLGWLVRWLDMRLLSTILEQFLNIGVIVIVIIFQPEIRRFLLILGKNAYDRRLKKLASIFNYRDGQLLTREEIGEIVGGVRAMSRQRLGALIIILKDESQLVFDTGVDIDALIRRDLLLAIFDKDSPLHDGAVTIYAHRIQKARVILPISRREKLPSVLGLRHRAAMGITESVDCLAVIVSEENGKISLSREGNIEYDVSTEKLERVLYEEFVEIPHSQTNGDWTRRFKIPTHLR